jgi:hypothetical protein
MWSMQQPLGLRVLVLRAARCTPPPTAQRCGGADAGPRPKDVRPLLLLLLLLLLRLAAAAAGCPFAATGGVTGLSP